MSVIDVEDIAAVAVKTLLEPGHMGKAYDLTGPQALDNTQIAATLSGVFGPEIHYMDISDMMVEAGLKGMVTPDVIIGSLTELSAANRESRLAAMTEDLSTVLGRPPRTFEEFARGNAGAWSRS
jgi:uncharacterized protein YbjT (DUF2867 family)